MIYQTQYQSPVGNITLASDGKNLVGLWLDGQKYFADSIKEEMHPDDTLPLFTKVKDWLERYFQGRQPRISELPLAPSGSEFRQMVWSILCEIPYGQTATYGEIAQKIARRKGLLHMSAQAVGGAVGHNPISIIIPCHRVIGTNGSLTGYAGGLDKKIKLLKLEGIDTPILFKQIIK